MSSAGRFDVEADRAIPGSRRMLGDTLSGALPRTAPPPSRPQNRLVTGLLRLGVRILARVLGTADGPAVAVVAQRELSLILRSREWHQFLGKWLVLCSAVLAVPILYRSNIGSWTQPSGLVWLTILGYTLQGLCALAMVQWTIRRLRRDLYTSRLDELLLTRCSAADVAMGEALASAVASLWLVAAAFPVCLLVSAMGGQGWKTAVLLALSIAPAGALGVWFGMGWGLAFTLRRSAAIVPLTKWWFLGPFLPIVIAWSILGAVPLIWAVLGLIPGGVKLLGGVFWFVASGVRQVVQHWNPLLVIGAATGIWKSTWLTDWLVLMGVTTFMMRKSMDAVQMALGSLADRDVRHHVGEAWIHHDAHYFEEEGQRKRPVYREGANPIAAFDVALGHRVYLHPFFWCVGLMAFLFLIGWSMLVPAYGRGTAAAAVLLPATAALLLMSGGVAISFGWERDQHRWPALAVLPISNARLALGKIKGVVRPTLWLGFLASFTALLMAWRGALPWDCALWMSLHVLVFPVALAFVSATLALTTPTLAEALYRWAILGAIPTLAIVLPYPIGGHGGLALPFTPPLVVLLIVIHGATPELVRAAWISLGLEIFGISMGLLILSLFLRRWTVGERD
jgi:hypothetical protein